MSKIPPVTREEHFLSRIAGDPTALLLEPQTRIEHFLQRIIDNGGGGGTPGEVTPASVVTATGQMSDAQKAQTRTNLGAVSTSTIKSALNELAFEDVVVSEMQYSFVNGKRIYKNGSQFSIFGDAVNYGYVDFLEVNIGTELEISADSGIKYYIYSTNASNIDETFTGVQTSSGWRTGTTTFTPQYEYLLICYYKEDSSALDVNTKYLTIIGELNSIFALKSELNSELDKTRVIKINEIKSIAEFAKDGLYLGNASEYRVGANRTYTTINEALTQWANDDYPKAVVYIDNGEYNETVYVEDKDISFIGESRDGVIVRTKTGNYTYPPFKIHHGNVLIANLTAIADHSGNPSFVDGNNGAYAFHIDGGTVGGVVTIKNCTAISYQSCAFGMGTIPNSKIRIEDCTAISYTNAGATALTLGCILNHLASPTIYPSLSQFETLELVNVKMYSENGNKVLVLSRGNNTTTIYKILAIDNVLASGVSDKDLVSLPNNPYQLDAMSAGNTDDAINS